MRLTLICKAMKWNAEIASQQKRINRNKHVLYPKSIWLLHFLFSPQGASKSSILCHCSSWRLRGWDKCFCLEISDCTAAVKWRSNVVLVSRLEREEPSSPRPTLMPKRTLWPWERPWKDWVRFSFTVYAFRHYMCGGQNGNISTEKNSRRTVQNLEKKKKNCQKNLVATAHHLATWVFHYDCVKWFCHFVFFFILTDCSPAEMPAGIFFIVSTFVSLHVPSAFRHHREGLNWDFDEQKRRSEAAYLRGLPGSHRQSEIRVFLSPLSNYNIKKKVDVEDTQMPIVYLHGCSMRVCTRVLLFKRLFCAPAVADFTGGH